MATLSSSTVFTGRVFSVARDRVQLPHGTEATLDIVRHRGSVVLLPMPDADSVMLVRQYRHTVGRTIWEVPAGTIDDGEDAETGARRECHEEVGCWPKRVELLGSFYPSPGYTTEIMHFYKLTELSVPDEAAEQDPDEHLEVRTVTLDELAEMIASGEVVDMKTVVAWQLAVRHSEHRQPSDITHEA